MLKKVENREHSELSVCCRYDIMIENQGIFVMSALSLSKTERIDVRTNPLVKHFLQDAARACHKNVSEFLLDAGITAANQTLADRQRFTLDEGQWQTFMDALDRC